MKKEVIDQVLEVAAQAAPGVESAVSGVKDKQLRGVIAGVIMQRILQEVGRDQGRTFMSPASSFADLKDAGKKAGTQARIFPSENLTTKIEGVTARRNRARPALRFRAPLCPAAAFSSLARHFSSLLLSHKTVDKLSTGIQIV